MNHSIAHKLSLLPGTCSLGVLLLTMLLGCGAPEGPAKFDVSGNVTYQGKPVPTGTVTFYPNTEKGTSGPTAQAKIVDGKYDTRSEFSKPTIAGNLIIVVDGFEAPRPNEEVPTPLFKPFQMEFEMPAESKILNIDVPSMK